MLQANGKYLWSTALVLAAQCTEVQVDVNHVRTDRVLLQEDVFGINIPASFFPNKVIINYCDIVKEALVLVRCMWVNVKRAQSLNSLHCRRCCLSLNFLQGTGRAEVRPQAGAGHGNLAFQ